MRLSLVMTDKQASATAEQRREVQIDIEHKYYEDSGLADAHATAGLAFHARLLTAVSAASVAQHAVLSGSVSPSPADVAAGIPAGHTRAAGSASAKALSPIALAILSQAPFSNPNDAPVLEYCTGVFAEPTTAPKVEPEAAAGVRVKLTFAPNPYFSNTEVSRVFGLGTSLSDDIDIVSADEGTQIQWNKGKDATTRLVKKQGRTGAVDRRVPVMSLFRLFTPDGLAAFGEEAPALLVNVKLLIKIAVFAVHAACGTRKMDDVAPMEEGDE